MLRRVLATAHIHPRPLAARPRRAGGALPVPLGRAAAVAVTAAAAAAAAPRSPPMRERRRQAQTLAAKGPHAIQRRLEVVENDRVGEALEDEGEFPKGVHAHGGGLREDLGDGQDVQDDKDEAQQHGDEHDAEARVEADHVAQANVVVVLDDPEQLGAGGHPPGVPKEGLERARAREQPAQGPVVEVGKGGVDFEDPVRLDGEDGAEEELAAAAAQKGLDLEPGHEAVDLARDVQANGRRREPPAVGGRGPKEVECLPASDAKLHGLAKKRHPPKRPALVPLCFLVDGKGGLCVCVCV